VTGFTRTNSGLTNLGLFHSVDFIVFVEGGSRTLNLGEVLEGKENSAPEDTLFWKLVLDRNGVCSSYVIKPIGSKASVMNIAVKIKAGDVKNVAAAMDRDLDDYFGGILKSPLILYTNGYSWEADVFTKDLTKSQIACFLFSNALEAAVESEIDLAYASFEKAGTKIARIEMIFRSQGIAWISKARGDRFFRPDNAGLLDRKNLKAYVVETKVKIQRPATCPAQLSLSLDPYKVNCGKLLRALSVAITRYIVKKYGEISSLQNDVISSVMLEKFGNSDNHVGSHYYSSAVAQLNSALSSTFTHLD